MSDTLHHLPLEGRSKPRSGFGWGSVLQPRPADRLAALDGCGDDEIGDSIRLPSQLGIAEAKHLKAGAREPDVTPRVMGRLRVAIMSAAVKLNDQPRLKTDEIRIVGADRRLTPEMQAVFGLAQISPEKPLIGRRLAAQFSSPFVGHRSLSDGAPHPKLSSKVSASPQGGGDAKEPRA